MKKEKLFGKTITEIQELVEKEGFPKYTGKQIADWLYKKDITEIEQMTNLSKKIREKLTENYTFGTELSEKEQTAKDGTKKYLYRTENDRFIETAFIPDKTRNTLCVSSQVGCKMGCKFCATGKQGFQAQLTAAEILNQFKSLPEKNSITNIVFMGMGEPLDNIEELLKALEILTSEYGFAMSPRRITVSTIGVVKQMRRILTETDCHIALSMHNPFEEERLLIMPAQKTNPLSEVLSMIKEVDFTGQRRVSFEYIMFKRENDQLSHAKKITQILAGLECRINLIRYHNTGGEGLEGTADEDIEIFKNYLEEKGFITTIRRSRGQDIDAACGLLSTKALLNQIL